MNFAVGDIVEINKHKYRILKIYPKKTREHDVFLCENIEKKYKECFTRFNFCNRDEYICKKTGPKKLWSKEELDIIKDGISKGMTAREISNLIPNRTEKATETKVQQIKEKLEILKKRSQK